MLLWKNYVNEEKFDLKKQHLLYEIKEGVLQKVQNFQLDIKITTKKENIA